MDLKLDPGITYALALEGGGARGAWQIGAWKALREAGIRIDAVAGSSVGSLNGAMIAMGDLDKAAALWENISYSRVMDVDDAQMSELMHSPSVKEAASQLLPVIREGGYDVTPLRELIRSTVDADAIRQSAIELFLVTFSVSDQKELELRAKDLDEETLWDMLLASAYFPAFKNEKLGGKRYTDGGVADVLPLHVLIENGYRNIIALRVHGMGVERPVHLPRGTELYTIEPSIDLGNELLFEAEQARRNLQAGYEDAMCFLQGRERPGFYGGLRLPERLETLADKLTDRPKERPERPDPREEGLRVCLLNDSFPPVVDGVANAVVNYGLSLHRQGDFCAVATPDYPDAADDAYPFPVVRYPSLDTSRLVGYRAGNPVSPATVKTLEGMDFNLLHTHCPIASTILARSLREEIQAPIVLTYHTKFDIDIAEAIKVPQIQELAIKLLVDNISACDQVWVVSRGAGDNLRSLGYQGEYVVMPNGVDLARGRANEAAVEALSEKYDLPRDVPVYLFLGRMMWYKGLRLILDALQQVRSQGREFRMVFVGDGLEREEVISYARELELDDWCRFPGAERDREKIRAWYTRADLFLFPSTFDTNGLVVREAAACSLGSLLIRGSCAAEDITDGETGILTEESADSIAAALLSPEATRENFRRIGETAAERIYLSWDDSVARAREQYRQVLLRWRAGEMHRKRAPFDWLFQRAGEAGEALSLAKTMLEKYLYGV
ncbi:MAG: patatin-like phospholipase family protein [Oscillospiraceae bacterium]|nr:patatin-like phospholipase family protein [Oscillospiraceae bacterium]